MPAVSLCCRVCATEHPLEATGTCTRCFGPLDPTYDWDALRASVSHASIEAGPASIWRYADLLPVDGAAGRPPRARNDAARPGPAPRRGARDRRALAQARHREPDPLLQGSRRRGGGPQGAGARLRHALLLLDREPRRRGRGPRRRGRPRRGRLRPERPRAGEARCGGRLRPEDLRGRRDLRPLLATLGGAVVRAPVGLRQRQPALVLRRGLEDARLRDRRAARLGDPGRRRDPDRVGRALPQGRPGLRRACRRSASSTATAPALFGGQAAGCEPVATAFREGPRVVPVRPDSIARSLAIGNPADGDFAVATARSTGGAIYTVAEDEIGANMADLAATTGVFGETATGVTLGALKAAVAAGRVGSAVARRAPRHRRRVEDARPRLAHLRSDHDRGRRRRVRRPGARRLMAGRSLFDKVWDRHVVRDEPGEPTLLYIDLHLVHEVTSPQAFEGLRLAGRRVRRPDLTVATMDHNVPTLPGPVTDEMAKAQLDALRANCEEFGIELHATGSGQRGHRPRDRPGARAHAAREDDRLRRQPHVDARRASARSPSGSAPPRSSTCSRRRR